MGISKLEPAGQRLIDDNARNFKGASAEAFAASHYLSLGFEVMWPARHSAHFDFVTYDPMFGLYAKVQVKTAYQDLSGLRVKSLRNSKYTAGDMYDQLFAHVDNNHWYVIPAEKLGDKGSVMLREMEEYRWSANSE